MKGIQPEDLEEDMLKTAYGYVRVSTKEQADEGISLKVQEKAIRIYARMRGIEIIDIIRDAGESTVQPLDSRPGGKRMLRNLYFGVADSVIGFKLCRLFRDVLDCRKNVDEWDRLGVSLHLIDLGGQTIDTSTAMGRFAITVLAAAAELEREKIRENTRAALAHKRANGERTGQVPFGYRVADTGRHSGKGKGALEPDPKERKVLKHMRVLRGRGWSYRRIAEHFNKKQIPARAGGRWHHTSIHRILSREAA